MTHQILLISMMGCRHGASILDSTIALTTKTTMTNQRTLNNHLTSILAAIQIDINNNLQVRIYISILLIKMMKLTSMILMRVKNSQVEIS